MNVDNNNLIISTSTGTIRSHLDDSIDALTNWINDLSQSIQNINIPNFDTYIKGIWGNDDKEGEDNMFNNEILNLYYERERKKLDKKYKEICDKNYNEHPAVKEYNDVVSEFETTLVELANKYNTEDEKVIVKTGYTNDYQYEIACDIKEVINKDVMDEKRKDLNDLKEYCDEVMAQLTLSGVLEYQVDVLKRYEILDKNGKINA